MIVKYVTAFASPGSASAKVIETVDLTAGLTRSAPFPYSPHPSGDKPGDDSVKKYGRLATIKQGKS
jgi:hypothetical protein